MRPKLPPELVGDDDLVASPPCGAKQLPEQDLRISGPDRRFSAFVVVAGVVEEDDPALSRCTHDADALLSRNPLVRAPRSECKRRDLDPRGTERPPSQVLHSSESMCSRALICA